MSASFKLRMRTYNLRLRYKRSVEMRTAFENLATGAYTPHQYPGDDEHWDETFNPEHWVTSDAGQPHRVVFRFAPLPPAAG